MEQILENYGAAIVGVIGVALGWLLKKAALKVEEYVASTSNTFDDKLLQKIKDVLKEVLEEANTNTASEETSKTE